jgi:hypothetical protein
MPLPPPPSGHLPLGLLVPQGRYPGYATQSPKYDNENRDANSTSNRSGLGEKVYIYCAGLVKLIRTTSSFPFTSISLSKPMPGA